MIWGRKPKPETVLEESAEPEDRTTDETDEDADVAADELSEDSLDSDDSDGPAEDAEADDEASDDEADEPDVDWRMDGPFDFEEVDLAADEVERLDLGSLILTPWEGMGLQLQVNEATQQVTAALAFWEQSGLELALYAAPTSGGLAAEFREDLTEEAEQAGGNASEATGPFGPELRRVLPAEGPNGEQMFQVARIWFAEGPRWLLRGSLLGEAALIEDDSGPVQPFAEFFRNVVVRRGDKPMVPGDIIAMALPQNAEA